MLYQDRIYGKIKIEEPVILDLIKSQALKRLKEIDQAGYRPIQDKFLGLQLSKKKLTRFEHSLGVFILLKKFNAPLKEQIAGLIHDISHTAFSHCIDYALKEDSEISHDYQDKIFEWFYKNSEIPKILEKHGFEQNEFLNLKNFPLLERELPDLCADRIDHFLRTAAFYKETSLKEIDYFLNNLAIINNFWVFKRLAPAKKLAKLFLKINKIYYSGLPSAIMFRTVGDVIKYALSKKYLKKEDLFKTDKIVIEKIKKNLKDKRLKLLFDRMQGNVKIKNNPKNYDCKVFCKSRVVDPLIKLNNQFKRLSEVDKSWKEIIERESKPKEYFLKFENNQD